MLGKLIWIEFFHSFLDQLVKSCRSSFRKVFSVDEILKSFELTLEFDSSFEYLLNLGKGSCF